MAKWKVDPIDLEKQRRTARNIVRDRIAKHDPYISPDTPPDPYIGYKRLKLDFGKKELPDWERKKLEELTARYAANAIKNIESTFFGEKNGEVYGVSPKPVDPIDEGNTLCFDEPFAFLDVDELHRTIQGEYEIAEIANENSWATAPRAVLVPKDAEGDPEAWEREIVEPRVRDIRGALSLPIPKNVTQRLFTEYAEYDHKFRP